MKKNNHNKELVISHAEIKRIIPPLVVSRAKSVGAVGEA